MTSKKIWANLGVSNLQITAAFYTAIGFTPNGSSEQLCSFTIGDDGFIIHFFLKEVLASNTGGRLLDAREGNEIIFSLSAESRQEVDDWVMLVEKAGGTISVAPKEFGKGYFVVFTDPDGHRFNVLHWPM